jgi:hypothetical protein
MTEAVLVAGIEEVMVGDGEEAVGLRWDRRMAVLARHLEWIELDRRLACESGQLDCVEQELGLEQEFGLEQELDHELDLHLNYIELDLSCIESDLSRIESDLNCIERSLYLEGVEREQMAFLP